MYSITNLGNEVLSINKIRAYLIKFSKEQGVSVPFEQIFKRIETKPITLCKLMNISEEYYKKLNNTEAIVLRQTKDSICVASKVNIKLPYKYTAKNANFAYEGVLNSKKRGKYFKYKIARENVHKVNLCAVAYSVGIKPRAYSELYKVLSVDGSYVYLQLIEYNTKLAYSKNIVSIFNTIKEARRCLETIVMKLYDMGAILDPSMCLEAEEGTPFSRVEDKAMLIENVEDFI